MASHRDLIAMPARSDAYIRDDVVAVINEIAPGGPPSEVSVEYGRQSSLDVQCAAYVFMS
ncbi:hypothetical protein [Actinomadura madurae]|uniref:hypothetical protein n=1 Tax=Actinomadura madurae TaxID=1993 RepID=UPI0020D1FA31|nr:hypothetical protein [Actinomadura madurae]MCP9948973.1 hypothetical protein [Actinomadura madurae]MCP9965746.1 hypothetical protein [Actinomadura madurae]MCP9978222.1 hypothetical protein [Actinomadura madurae]MCQ0010265.1 hypothetical protein [Actinomadura madurae]MCQ0014424.1 hypothetical protein [Actinomadura madurae]